MLASEPELSLRHVIRKRDARQRFASDAFFSKRRNGAQRTTGNAQTPLHFVHDIAAETHDLLQQQVPRTSREREISAISKEPEPRVRAGGDARIDRDQVPSTQRGADSLPARRETIEPDRHRFGEIEPKAERFRREERPEEPNKRKSNRTARNASQVASPARRSAAAISCASAPRLRSGPASQAFGGKSAERAPNTAS